MKISSWLGLPGSAALYDEHHEQRQQRLTRSQESLDSGVIANPIIEDKVRREHYRRRIEEKRYHEAKHKKTDV